MAGGPVKLKTKLAKKAAQRPPTKSANVKGKTPPTQNMEEPFGAVGRIAQAPVNIGTTIRSAPAKEVHGRDTVLVTGRDYITQLTGQVSTATTWSPCGGFPVTPMCLTTSVLKGYFLAYQKFKFRRLVLHYISSSPTSTSGDILLIHHANRAGPYVDHTSTNFLSYALSTPSAVLGPQWLNKSLEVVGIDTYGWLDTDLFNSEDVQHQAAGEVLVYGKNTSNGAGADSPGYLVIDYMVEFSMKMVNPRSTALPITLGKITTTAFIVTNGVVTGSTPLGWNIGGTGFDGVTAVAPTGLTTGMIFKIGCDVSNSASWTNITKNTMAVIALDRNGAGTASNLQQVVFQTGMTLYGVWDGTAGTMWIYPTYDAALTGNSLYFGTAATVTFQFPAWMSLVGSVTTGLLQASI